MTSWYAPSRDDGDEHAGSDSDASNGVLYTLLVPIDLFLIALEGDVDAAEKVLDASEIERANRFRRPHLRERYILSHAVLRLLLGRAAKSDPRALRFVLGEKGKPRLEGSRVTFNLSHSGDFAAIALTDEIEVGVDVEEMRPLRDFERLARHTFSSGECADFFTLNGDALAPGFYRCWTRKEAVIKALGAGLSYPLKKFRVSLLPDEAPSVLEIGVEGAWQLHSFDVADGYAGALAYRGKRRDVAITRASAAAVISRC